MTDAQVIRRQTRGSLPLVRAEEQKLGEIFAERARSRARVRRLAFLVLVFAPTFVSAVYFGFLASSRYVSETAFVVRGVSSSRSSGLEALFRSFGIARTVDDTNIVENYLVSRDALRDLIATMPVRQMFARPEADWLSRFPRPFLGDDFEQLYGYYQSRVKVVEDSERGLARLYVNAFRADDAQKISQQLLAQAELFVNKLNDRAQEDSVHNAQADVQLALDKVVAAQSELTVFRNNSALVDPSKNSTAQVELIAQLTTDRDEVLAQLAQNQALSANSPNIPVLKAKADALSARIVAEREKLAGEAGSLSGKVSTYERLTTLKDLADKTLAGAVLSLEGAKQEAQRQQIYIEEVVTPNLPDVPTEPRRFRIVLQVFFVTMSLLSVMWIFSVGIKEHHN